MSVEWVHFNVRCQEKHRTSSQHPSSYGCFYGPSIRLSTQLQWVLWANRLELGRPDEGESTDIQFGDSPWLTSLRAPFPTSSLLRTPSQPLHPIPALQASQADSSWARHWQYNRAVIIGPYSFLRDNPRLGWAFSVPSLIFLLMFTQGMYRFLLLLRPLLRLYTSHVCFNVCLSALLLQRGC